ncbi:DUF6884 domain-containing protein [Prescottella subtropica]|uniref:DUF6884 domain-containing protein n=1 Tax=Prescottella subtropica TaxID=2545757 RepID=UPI001F4F19DF|nr:DUF6884 domain-containing protein [Prescottella subtropica]
MPRIHAPTYRYTDPTLTAPQPGRALITEVGLVESLPGIGPKTGGQHVGIPLAVGPRNTRLLRPYDGIEISLSNTDLQLWTAPFHVAAHTRGVFDLADRDGWQWLRWTIADHIEHDRQTSRDNAGAGSRPLVIVPCGAAKVPTTQPVRASHLYTGTYHRLGLRAAAALTNTESTRILSGKHGLLRLDEPVAPYDLRLGQPGAVTADDVIRQARTQGILDRPHVIALGGRDYTRLVLQVWPHATTPLAGSRGIGEQQQRLATIAAGTSLAALAA